MKKRPKNKKILKSNHLDLFLSVSYEFHWSTMRNIHLICDYAKPQYANEISLAYCGYLFFTHYLYVFNIKSMKLKTIKNYTLRNCSTWLVLWIFSFLTDFFTFQAFKAIFGQLRPTPKCFSFPHVPIITRTVYFYINNFESAKR